ncbi:MAG TPA: WYL domain-containing protein [Rhizobium sp.]
MENVSIARTLAEQVSKKPVPKSPIPILLPDEDEAISAKLENLGYAEGQSFAIEYVDSAKRPSTRRITVWGIVAGAGGVPSLIAFCHERKAQRQFRIDRIQCFIDYDGEVFSDIPVFLQENFGMNILLGTKTAPDGDRRWRRVLDSVKHDAVLLSALSRSDGKTSPQETEIATDHLSRLAENAGMMLEDAEILAIYRYANRLRPTEEAIMRALEHAAAQGHRHVQKLLNVAIELIDADGQRHHNEIALINSIALDLTGMAII